MIASIQIEYQQMCQRECITVLYFNLLKFNHLFPCGKKRTIVASVACHRTGDRSGKYHMTVCPFYLKDFPVFFIDFCDLLEVWFCSLIRVVFILTNLLCLFRGKQSILNKAKSINIDRYFNNLKLLLFFF